MCMQEMQTDKVTIDANILGDWQEYYWVRLIRIDLTIMEYLLFERIFQSTVKMRSSSGGYSVCECSICILSGTSIAIMCHGDIHDQCVWRMQVVFTPWQDHIVLDLDVSTCISCSGSYFVGFNPVSNRTKQLSLYTIHSCAGSAAD